MTFCELGRYGGEKVVFGTNLLQERSAAALANTTFHIPFYWSLVRLEDVISFSTTGVGFYFFVSNWLLWLFVYWHVVCFATIMEIDSIFQWRVKWIMIFTAWFYGLIFIDCDKQDSSRKEIVLIFYLLVCRADRTEIFTFVYTSRVLLSLCAMATMSRVVPLKLCAPRDRYHT